MIVMMIIIREGIFGEDAKDWQPDKQEARATFFFANYHQSVQ